MSSFKKKLTEQEAAAQFVFYIFTESWDVWPIIHKDLKDGFKEGFIVEDENMAAFNFALAAIAQDLQAVKNLFPHDQAERIEKLVLRCVDVEYGGYAIDEVKKYSNQFQMAIQNISSDCNALDTIPGRLLQRLLGKNIKNFCVKMNNQMTDMVSPILIVVFSGIFINILGTWKKLKDNFNIVDGNMPFDEAPGVFSTYQLESDEKGDDETI